MKICHMSSIRDSNDLVMLQREAVLADGFGYEVFVIAKGESRKEGNIRVVGAGVAPRSRLKRMLIFTRRIYQAALAADADLYLIHDPELLPYALKLKRRGKKVVFDSHELYAVLLRSKAYLPFANMAASLYACFERYAVGRLDAVILPAPLTGGKDPFLGISKRTVFAANYAPLNELYACYRPRDSFQPPKLCFVGIMTPDRGIERMIQATEQAGMPLLLAGSFAPEAYGKRIMSLSGWRWVDFRGVLDRDAVCALYQEATMGICVMPGEGQYHISDTFNMKVYDYMAMGLPVILGDSPYARQVMKKYPFGILVDPSDIDAIAAAARFLARRPQEAMKMGLAGRRAIAEAFNWERESEKLLSLYRDLIGPPG